VPRNASGDGGDDRTTSPAVSVRQARASDADAVAAFTADTWEEFEGSDYVPDVFEQWVATDGDDQHTVVAERETGSGDGAVVGCCQVARLSAHEAWTQGIRVHPDHRGSGVGRAMDAACRRWARERGGTVARNMVFSWNEQGLATARSLGYEPRTEFRWAHPDPDADATVPGGGVVGDDDAMVTITDDPDALWGYWQRSDAREALGGLALDPVETWALSEWTRERARETAGEGAVFALQRDGTTGVAWRTRVSEREDGDWAEYGGAGWETLADARALFGAIARDAAAVGADRVRVLIPETPRHVSDAAAAGVTLADDPDFVFECDLSGGPDAA